MDVKSDGPRPDPGIVSLLTQLNKAVHGLASEELLGMRFKPYMTLSYIRDHPGVTQQELESELFMDADSVVLILNETEAAQLSVRRRVPNDRRSHSAQPRLAGHQ